MKPSILARQKIQAARHWVFRWRGLDGTPLRGLLALLITGGVFSLFAATVQIRVSAPQQWVERKASIIHLPNDGEGKMWALRAREGGPFPSRLNPAEWESMPGGALSAIAATRLPSETYTPKLAELPSSNEGPAVSIAAKGERIFPKRMPESVPGMVPVETKLVPALYPLSGISIDAVPRNLPAFQFDEKIEPSLTSAPWRFMLRLRPDGSVAECLPMIKEIGGAELEKWICGVNFSSEVAKKSEWIGIAVGFVNQPVHESDPR